MLENYSQTMVKTHGRTAFGCDENLVCHPSIPLAQEHGCNHPCEDVGSGPAVPLAAPWYQKVPQSAYFKAADRVQLGRFDVVRSDGQRFQCDAELTSKVPHLTVQRDDQERGAVHA